MNPSLYGYRIIVLQNRKSKQRLMEVFSFLTQPDFFFCGFFSVCVQIDVAQLSVYLPSHGPSSRSPFPFFLTAANLQFQFRRSADTPIHSN